MLLQCLHGEREIWFGKRREIKYKFRRADPDDPKSPALCEVKEVSHLQIMLGLPHKFEAYCRTDEERAAANEVMAQIVKSGGVSQATAEPRPELPFLSLTEDGEESVRIEVELPKAAYQAIVAGTHELDIVERVQVPEAPAGGLDVGEEVRDLLDGGTKVDLLAYCKEHHVNHNRNWPEDKLRSAVREHKLLPLKAA